MDEFLATKEPGAVFTGDVKTPNCNCALLSSVGCGNSVLKCLPLLYFLIFLTGK